MKTVLLPIILITVLFISCKKNEPTPKGKNGNTTPVNTNDTISIKDRLTITVYPNDTFWTYSSPAAGYLQYYVYPQLDTLQFYTKLPDSHGDDIITINGGWQYKYIYCLIPGKLIINRNEFLAQGKYGSNTSKSMITITNAPTFIINPDYSISNIPGGGHPFNKIDVQWKGANVKLYRSAFARDFAGIYTDHDTLLISGVLLTGSNSLKYEGVAKYW